VRFTHTPHAKQARTTPDRRLRAVRRSGLQDTVPSAITFTQAPSGCQSASPQTPSQKMSTMHMTQNAPALTPIGALVKLGEICLMLRPPVAWTGHTKLQASNLTDSRMSQAAWSYRRLDTRHPHLLHHPSALQLPLATSTTASFDRSHSSGSHAPQSPATIPSWKHYCSSGLSPHPELRP